MQQPQTNLLLRGDTILGVCEAIGQDFGFNPNWLRVALCASLFFNPVVTVGSYLALGIGVALARWIAPDKRPAAEASVTRTEIEANDEGAEALPIAA